MDIKIFSLFPEMFTGPLGASLLGKARSKDILNIDVVNFREYSTNKHRSVDDYPFGGGAGMVLQPEPVISALRDHLDLNDPDTEIILMSPQGRPFNQEAACELSKKKRLAFICGHYEGFDERIRAFVTAEYSIGDYVLTGGELPAMVMIDAISRLLEDVLHNDTSAEFETFHDNLLEYPQYSRPETWNGKKVPEVLLSGHHANIEKWRREQSIMRTVEWRPDLIENAVLSKKEKQFLDKYLEERKKDLH